MLPVLPSIAASANPQSTSNNLLADIFSSPAPAASVASSGSADLLSMTSTPAAQSEVQNTGDNSEDLFKVVNTKFSCIICVI